MIINQFDKAVGAGRRAPGSVLTALALTIAGTAIMASPSVAAPVKHHADPQGAATGAHETVEHRIASLHAALKITNSEEPGWQRVAEIMRRNDAVMRAMKADPELGAAKISNAVSDLKTYEKFNQAHVNGLADLIPAFATLYATMPRLQQIVADGVFRKFGRGDVKSHG